MLFISLPAFADLKTETYVFLKPEKVDQLISTLVPEKLDIKDVEFDLGDFDGLDGMEFSNPILSLTLAPTVKSNQNGELVGNLILETGSLRLKDFKYREIRYIDEGIVKARVNINVDCSELVLGFKNSVGFFEATPRVVDGKLQLPEEDRGFSFESNELDVDLSNCVAPRNIEGLFVETLEEWLNSEDGQSLVEKKAFLALEDYVNELIETELSGPVFLNNEFSVNFKSLDFIEGVWRIGTSLSVKHEKTLDVKYGEAPLPDRSNKNQIVLPKSALSLFVPQLFESINLPINVVRSQITGVGRLFNSRLIQFFAWSDLMNFKKNVNFDLDIFFFNNKLRYLGQQNGQIYYRLKNNHWMDMNFLGGDQKFPYMQLLGDTDAQIGLKFEGSVLKMQFLDIGADTSANFHPKMKNWRRTRTRGKPSLSLILPSVLNGLEGFEYDYDLNTLLGDQSNLIQNIELIQSEESLNLSFD